MNGLQAWLPIIIAALALFGGTGWLQWWLSRRREEHERWRADLSEFLRPLQSKLHETDFIFHELIASGELQRLEYSPGQLKYLFGNLPDGDPTKAVWEARIERLQRLNRDVVALINQFYGQIQLNEFRTACHDFKNHASAWEDMWNSVKDKSQAVATGRDNLQTGPFPSTFEPALQAEINLVSRRAGGNA